MLTSAHFCAGWIPSFLHVELSFFHLTTKASCFDSNLKRKFNYTHQKVSNLFRVCGFNTQIHGFFSLLFFILHFFCLIECPSRVLTVSKPVLITAVSSFVSDRALWLLPPAPKRIPRSSKPRLTPDH